METIRKKAYMKGTPKPTWSSIWFDSIQIFQIFLFFFIKSLFFKWTFYMWWWYIYSDPIHFQQRSFMGQIESICSIEACFLWKKRLIHRIQTFNIWKYYYLEIFVKKILKFETFFFITSRKIWSIKNQFLIRMKFLSVPFVFLYATYAS